MTTLLLFYSTKDYSKTPFEKCHCVVCPCEEGMALICQFHICRTQEQQIGYSRLKVLAICLISSI